MREQGALSPAMLDMPTGLGPEKLSRLIVGIQAAFLRGESKSAFALALEVLKLATGSSYGFIGEVLKNPEGQPFLRTHAITNIAWNAETRKFHDDHVAKGLEFRNLDTLFGEVLRTGKPILANQASRHPAARGVPPGHPPLDAFLGAPILVGGEMVAMVGLANRPCGYDLSILEAIQPLLDTIGVLVLAAREREAKRKSDEALKQALAEADEALRNLNAYQGALDKHAIVAMTDSRGVIVFVNELFIKISGYAREELIGRTHSVVNSGTHPKSFFSDIWRTISGGQNWHGEICNRAKNGSLYWVDTTIVPLFDANGAIHRYVSIRYDVTSKKIAEEGLKVHKDAISKFFDVSLDMLCLASFDGRFVQVNSAFTKALGYDVQDLQGTRFIDLVHPDDAAPTLEAVSALEKGDAILSFVNRYRAVDGSYRSIEWRSIPHGGLIYAAASDITERLSRETELEATRAMAESLNQKLLLATETANIGIWMFDPETGRLDWNDQMFSIFGVDRSTFRGKLEDWSDRVHPDDLQTAQTKLAESAQSGGFLSVRFRIVRPDGELRVIEGRGTLDKRDPGSRTVLGVNWDATEYLQATERAEAATRAKSTFIAHMSHEIRTPLNGVVGLAGSLARTRLDARQQEMVQLIQLSGDTLERLLCDILELSKIEAGKLELHPENFELCKAIESAAEIFRVRADEKGLRFDLTYAPKARGIFHGDATRLRQIVSNLVSNAVKFTATGRVSVSVDVVEDDVGATRLKVEVVDTGSGIPPEMMPRLFAPFEQADNSMTARSGGSGLGLSICKKLIDLMGGAIRVTSSAGTGSHIEVVLPLPRAAFKKEGSLQEGAVMLPGPDAEESADWSRQSLRVLLAEDHPVNQRMVCIALEGLNATIDVANDGGEAVEAFKAGAYDLILMDMQMPEMNGIEATCAIRELERQNDRPRTPIIFLTAYAMKDRVQQANEAGCDGYITKPVTPVALISGIHRVLRDRAASAPGVPSAA